MKLLHGNCLDKLKELKANSIDTIITDPPYGLSFMGKKWDYDVPSEEVWKECLRVLKPGGTALIFAGSRTSHRMAVRVEDAGFELKDTIMWLYGSGFPKATDISKQLDKGKRGRIKFAQSNTWREKEGREDRQESVPDNTPVSPEAKLWNGWKSHGLKPAYEPILVAVKPNEGTYANNALKYGVSGLNIDGGRIGTEEEIGRDNRNIKNSPLAPKDGWNENSMKGLDTRGNTTGRFPANIILDEEAGKMLDEQSGESKSSDAIRHNKKSPMQVSKGWNNNNMVGMDGHGYSDKGGASRFFYCAKSSKAERNKGCEGLEDSLGGSLEGGNDKRNGDKPQLKMTKNNHPTVKPIKLMEYLCTLTKTPTGGVVLDPFMGSGTTGIACQNTGRDFIGIEREAEYMKICEARLGVKAENYTEPEVKEEPKEELKVEVKSDLCECGGKIKKIDGGRCCEDCLKDY